MSKPSILISTLKRRMLPAAIAFASVMVSALAYLKLTPHLYETSARLLINSGQVSVSDLGRDLASLPEGAGGANPLATQAELAKSQRVLERAINELSRTDPGAVPTVGQLSQGLRVKIVPGTSILEMSYRGEDPEMTAEWLNAVMSSIAQENVENIRAGARSVRKFLEVEVPRQRVLLEQAEAAENRYRQATGLVAVEDQVSQTVQNLGAVENQERDLAAQLQEVTVQNLSLKQLVGEQSRQNAYTAVRAGQDEELKSLRTKLEDLETQVIELRSRLGDQHPDLLALTEQRDEVRQLYENRLSQILTPGQSSGSTAGDALSQDLLTRLITSDISRAALEQKIAAVRNTRINLQSRLADLPVKQQSLATLARTREEAESTLKQLQSKLQEARIAEAQLVSNIQVLSVATPPSQPMWPKKSSVLVTAAVLGFVLSIGVVLLLEFLDQSLYDIEEAEELFGQPTLGTLPVLPSPSRNLTRLNESEFFLDDPYLVEPYRKLLKTLEFRSAKNLRLLVVSSAAADEGKSTVVSHLAAVSAMLSQRTLIIDADLHRSTQQRLFNLPSEPGLTEVLSERSTLAEAIQPINSHLFVLPGGGRSRRPSLLLESATMRSLLEEATQTFDLVILDTPPVNSCADALLLTRFSDGLLFVVRPGTTTRSGLAQAAKELNKNGALLMGMVANGVHVPIDRDYFDSSNRQRRSSKLLRHLPLSRTPQSADTTRSVS